MGCRWRMLAAGVVSADQRQGGKGSPVEEERRGRAISEQLLFLRLGSGGENHPTRRRRRAMLVSSAGATGWRLCEFQRPSFCSLADGVLKRRRRVSNALKFEIKPAFPHPVENIPTTTMTDQSTEDTATSLRYLLLSSPA